VIFNLDSIHIANTKKFPHVDIPWATFHEDILEQTYLLALSISSIQKLHVRLHFVARLYYAKHDTCLICLLKLATKKSSCKKLATYLKQRSLRAIQLSQKHQKWRDLLLWLISIIEQILWGWSNQGVETRGYTAHMRKIINTHNFLFVSHKERNHSENLRADRRIILK
jgi:hypothetical protein